MKIRKELLFGFGMMALVVLAVVLLMPWGRVTNEHLGLLMLALIVVTILLGFPTAFTLMGMGVIFAWLYYRSVDPALADRQVLDLMVQRTYGAMSNDVLIAVPLFIFMGYLVERAALIDRLFRSLHLALTRVPGSLAVATIATCALFATATGIVGAVVTLMGLLALPAMLRSGYNVKISAGAITAGGCLGILIPPSVLLILYGATAGVSVVQLYAGALFPGLMLAGLYVAYVMLLAVIKTQLMPPLSESERRVPLPAFAQQLAGSARNALAGLLRALTRPDVGVPKSTIAGQLVLTLLPALVLVGAIALSYRVATAPSDEFDTAGLIEMGGTGLAEAPSDEELDSGEELQDLGAESEVEAAEEPAAAAEESEEKPAAPLPTWFWVVAGICIALLVVLYSLWSWERFEVFKLLLTSFFPLAMLILAVLGSIMFGLATPTEAAALGALGGFVLAAVYRTHEHLARAKASSQATGKALIDAARDIGGILKESSFLAAKTSAMVCWLFVGSAIFSAAFALLGGQGLIERWVLSLDLTPVQFLILAQVVIFLLGWPLEWTEIIIIFMPIFLPLVSHFDINPLFFGLLVALNLQTAFLSPPVAMSAFYLKGVAPPHVTLGQIFMGMMPYMGIQILAMIILYMFPQIGLWLPSVLY